MTPAPAPEPAGVPEVTAKRRRAAPWRWVFAGFLVSLLLAGAAAVFIYFEYIRYERTAALHLPPDTTIAARVDLEKVVLYEPFRAQILPLANEASRDARLKPRLERFEAATQIELAVDIREIALAFGPGAEAWTLAIGGKFPKEGVVEGVAEVLKQEGIAVEERADILVTPSGVSFGQADDGVLIVASTPERVRASLPAQNTHAALGLPLEGPGALAVSRSLLAAAATSPARLLAPSLAELAKVERAHASLELAQDVQVTATLELAPGTDAASFAAAMQSLLAGLQTVSALLPGQDFAGERAVLGRARVAVAGPEAVTVSAPWLRAEVERGAASLAAFLRLQLGLVRALGGG